MASLLHILYLEDDPLDVDLALETLRADGLEVQIERVANLPELMAALEDRPFDLILGDYRVPGSAPLEALRLANKLRPGVPFVFLSGTISEDLAIEMLKHGATDYVFKHRMNRLAPAVRRALQEAAEQRSRRQAEEEARMFKFFSENANDGHILFNHDTKILYANKLASERLGYTQEELRRLTVPDIDPMFTKKNVQALFQQCKETRGKPFEGVHKCKDGSTFPVEITCAVLEGEGQSLIFGTSRDITERKRADKALRESEHEAPALSRSLEKRVEERTAELQEKTRHLRRLAAALTTTEQRERKRFAALIHDDLQQLLVAAKMDLTSLKRRIRRAEDVETVERVGDWIASAISAARDLTSQLRPPALYEGGFVAALHWLASQTWERHRVRISIEGKEPSRPIGDEFNALLFDCVREVIFNLVKHAGVNEGVVSVREEEYCLRVGVRDHGRGFDLEAISSEHSHSGFGLFSIRERLLSIGGDVSIESAPGEGTRIALMTPLSVMERSISDVQKNSDALVHARRGNTPDPETDRMVRVLVVDDHAMVRQGLATIIDGDSRMTVVGEAADGLQAIEAIEAHQPDVILIDVNMPRMNGIDATLQICRRWPGSIVIGLSVQDDEATAKLMRTAGAKAFLSKAGDADHMISIIHALHPKGQTRARASVIESGVTPSA